MYPASLSQLLPLALPLPLPLIPITLRISLLIQIPITINIPLNILLTPLPQHKNPPRTPIQPLIQTRRPRSLRTSHAAPDNRHLVKRHAHDVQHKVEDKEGSPGEEGY